MIIDISHWNKEIDFSKVKVADVEKVIIKCSNGSHDVDSMYAINSKAAQDAGIKTGSYHFMLYNQDPEKQAANFMRNIIKTDTEIPVLDLEWNYKNGIDQWKYVTPASRVAMLGRFIKAMKNNYSNLMIYTNIGWWKQMIGANNSFDNVIFSDCKLWVADYTTTPDNNLNINGWKPTMRQYTEKGIISGINGFVDLNRNLAN